ncbi:MAG TPA: amino acid--[acyl-carrier-protein] ligase [Thermoanaerobaculia bacterium]|jgi:seryl-tRNA synthetase
MTVAADPYQSYLSELVEARLLIPSGVRGVYGLAGAFEAVLEGFDAYVSRNTAESQPEVIRFPPLLSRKSYQQTDHLETFPNLMGSVHSFMGNERQLLELASAKAEGKDWSGHLSATDVMMTPAVCYPLYPTVTGTLPEGGRTVDLRGFVFRHEPSDDPARLQAFRMHELVRLGTPDQALAHRDHWIERGEAMLRAVGLDAKPVLANDPFFGRGGRVMAATQREQELKFELVAPVASEEKLTAVASSNYHLDHFGEAFHIKSADGAVAHSACVGFGLERVTLALFRKHGFEVARWPSEVRGILGL